LSHLVKTCCQKKYRDIRNIGPFKYQFRLSIFIIKYSIDNIDYCTALSVCDCTHLVRHCQGIRGQLLATNIRRASGRKEGRKVMHYALACAEVRSILVYVRHRRTVRTIAFQVSVDDRPRKSNTIESCHEINSSDSLLLHSLWQVPCSHS
jgi:hypothetical protein